jgi:2-polyprenyl-3-methyl-5-hydroxy-6-metoxy-1,4-benzoquinol methylase
MEPCRACRSNKNHLLFTLGEDRVAECLDCGLVYLDVFHDPSSIQQMYDDYDTGRDFYFDTVNNEVNENIDNYLRRCRQFNSSSQEKLRLLDIGCGVGILLARANRSGFMCEGVEICDPLAKATEEKVRCKVHRAFLRDAGLSDNSFDVITMYDLIEHLPEPLDEIYRAYQLLRPGGILFILTPNNDALLRRVAKWAYQFSFHQFKKPMRTLYYSHHLSYFNRDSLTRLLRQLGFEILHTETRNQELSRLSLSKLERGAVRTLFRISERYPSSGGKVLVWARKQQARDTSNLNSC